MIAYNEPENDVDIRPGDIATASLNTLAAISQGSWRAFTWDNDQVGFEPLIVDMFTASAMMQVYDALEEANQAKFRRMIGAGRGSFARLLEFTWKRVA